jgi:hypothetical protein
VAAKLVFPSASSADDCDPFQPGHQVTVIAFNYQSYLLRPLTTDKQAVYAALRNLPSTTEIGTAIHRGMEAGLTELSPWIFRNALTNAAQAAAAAAYGLKQNIKKFVIFEPDDPYGRDLTRVSPVISVSMSDNISILAGYGLPNSLDLTLFYMLASLCGVLVLGRALRIGSFIYVFLQQWLSEYPSVSLLILGGDCDCRDRGCSQRDHGHHPGTVGFRNFVPPAKVVLLVFDVYPLPYAIR